MKRIIITNKAPKAIASYSQAVECRNTLYISGQIAIDPETGNIVNGGIREQTERVMENIGAILHEAGYNYLDVVKSTCLLSDMSDYAGMNEVYSKYYKKEFPARVAFAVKELPLNVLIEIETIAMK